MSDISLKDRGKYQATFGYLIDKLKTAKKTAKLKPKIVGIGAYRGYYSDIALCTESGNNAYKSELDYDSPTKDWNKWHKENEIKIDFIDNPHKLAETLESLIGSYFDGYKGGYNKITREKPLWIATDYGDCSNVAVMKITNDLKLITKELN